MTVGFKASEIMEGYHQLADGSKHPMRFNCDWYTTDVKTFLNPASQDFLTCQLVGRVWAPGLGLLDGGPILGTLELNYPKRYLRYEFTAEVGLGDTYVYRHFVGEKVNLWPWNLPTSHTTCFGTWVDGEDRLLSRAVVLFKMKHALSFLRSFRVFLAP